MRILIHGINFSPELTGIGKYSGEMAEWLAAQGHEVRVVTAPPYYPQWKVAEGFSNGWSKEVRKIPPNLPLQKREECGAGFTTKLQESLPGKPTELDDVSQACRTEVRPTECTVTIYRCPLWVPHKPTGLKRILHLASFALSSLPVMLRQVFWKPNVVWVVEPALFCAPGALLTAKLCGATSWLHVQDFEVDAAFEMGLLRSQKARRIALWAERVLMRRFDKVSSISTKMQQRLLEKGIEPARSFLFRNWVDTKSISFIPSSLFRKKLNIRDDEFVALYSGNMGEKQGLEIVIEAARLLADDRNIRFVLCGDGAAKTRLQEMATGFSNIKWLPLQPLEKLNELLNLANVHLLPQSSSAADLVMPSKLTGMLASGRPVLATAEQDTELDNVLVGRGLVVSPGNKQDFANAIRMLSVNEGLCAILGNAGRKYAEENLESDAVLATFENALVELKKKR